MVDKERRSKRQKIKRMKQQIFARSEGEEGIGGERNE